MDITYLGHSAFKLRGKRASVIADPFRSSVGFSIPRSSSDIVTVSHDHDDHNNVSAVSGTSRRDKPFVIRAPGEYEVSGVSVFGFRTFHDSEQGAKRGSNTVYIIHIDEVIVAHLGDLGHLLKSKLVEKIGDVDVLLLPVGGVYTIDPKRAIEVISQLQPSVVVPMHFQTKKHDQKTFGKLASVKDFLSEGSFDQALRKDKLTLTKSSLPDEMEVVVLKS